MKRLLLALLAALLLCACPQVTLPEIPQDNVFVKNSAWHTVRSERLDPASRALSSTDALVEEIAAHNAANPDDKWFGPYVGEAPAIEAAPTADAWFVDSATNKRLREFHDVPRVDLEVRREAWRDEVFLVQSLNGGRPVTLYVDNEPPAEVEEPPTPVTDPYVIYAEYIIDASGGIVYEHHSADQAEHGYYMRMYSDEVFLNGQTGPGTPWRTHFGSLYVPPEAP